MGLTYDQKRPGRTKLRSDAFAMFYGAINIGATISSFAMPWIRDRYGYAAAFLFPAAMMTVAFVVFASGKPFYGVETIQRVRLTPEQRRERLVVLRRIFGLFIVVTFFWSIFDQSATTWTLFARDGLALDVFNHPPGTWQHSALALLRDSLGIDLFGVSLPPDLLQAFNPLLIVLLLPPITMLWHGLARIGYELKPTSKMLIGFVLTTITMAIMSWAGFLAAEAGRVSVLWEVVPYVLITAAEICISVVGLELAFTAAPATMKSFVTACWLLTISFGDILNAQITPLYGETVFGFELSPGRYFALFALVMVPVTAAFVVMSRRFNQSSSLCSV
jgi:POT family proton-dependent oligopeptide transporter